MAALVSMLVQRLDWRARRQFETVVTGYLDAVQPDLVHAHFAGAAQLVAGACRRAGVPLIVTLRGYDASQNLHRRRMQRRYRKLFASTRAVVLVSDEMRVRIAPLVPAGVPLLTIHAGRRIGDYPFRFPAAPIRSFVSVGRLVEKKGHDDAIRAIGFARRRGADVHLRIIGDGPHRHRLEGLVRNEDLAEFVRIEGAMAHADVRRALSRADACILACRTARNGDREGVPNVIKEAQLTGLPVISTLHGGVVDVIPACNHRWLAPEGDWERLGELVHSLAAAGSGMLRDSALAGRRHVEQHFALEGRGPQVLGFVRHST
jgi:colanic acid/amylovoran biosynthesis glycosyltransferase